MDNKLDKITFLDTDTNTEVELFVIEQTTISGSKYLLVAESDTDESDAYIFKEVSESDTDITYAPIEDDDEYEALIKVFSELLKDTEVTIGK